MSTKDKPSSTRSAKPRASAEATADRGKSIQRSWSDKKVAAARSQRNGVRVAGTEYRSVAEAFRELKLPFNQHAKFRAELKATASGRKSFTDEKGTAHAFTLLASDKA